MARTPLTFMAWLRWDLIRRGLAGMAPGASVVEFGAGLGALGARLATEFDYTALEPDPLSVEVARARIGAAGGRVVAGTDEDLPDDAAFDVACAFEVLEHFDDDEAILRRWVSHLRPGGRLILSVPAGPDRMGPHDELVGHYRRYSRHELQRKLAAAGLVDVEVGCYGWPLGYALEWFRNQVARRRLQRQEVTRGDHDHPPTPAGSADAADVMEQRTASSGRTLQPPTILGAVTWLVTRPFRLVQSLLAGTDRGIGYVVHATRP